MTVRALIAHLNGGGDAVLRALESRLLGIGVTVSRSDEDLLRYHGKMMIVDGGIGGARPLRSPDSPRRRPNPS